jgi:hypothetical protein
MKPLLCLSVLLCSSAYADHVSMMKPVEPYPKDWPSIANIISDCTDAQGTYSDPNKKRHLWEEFPGAQTGSKVSRHHAAWRTFAFSGAAVRSSDVALRNRELAISFDADKAIRMKYLIDGDVVAEKVLTEEDYSCSDQGLLMTVHKKTGKVWRQTSFGHVRVQTLVNKKDGVLYVRQTNRSISVVYSFLPYYTKHVKWDRFNERVDY